ncbi:MAG: PD-(D/E)XK nuclease family protein [Patescibacteria group bacterium]
MRTSYSALETYKTCPLKYKFQEIDRIKTPKRVEQVFGTVVHSALKKMFERNPLYPTLDEILDFYTTKWSEASERIEWKDPVKREAEEKLYFAEGRKLLENFFKKNSPWNFNAIELEGRFSIELSDEETGRTHTLAGTIDRLDKNPESDTYEIIDYKTGKKMPSQEMLEEDMQLGAYTLALTTRWPHIKPESVKTTLYFLKHNDSVSAVNSVEKLERVKRRVLTIIREIEKRMESGEFEPMPGPLCNYCGFRPLCPMWAHEYKTDEEKKVPDEALVADAIREFFELKESEDSNKERLSELKDIMNDYMTAKNVARVFGDDGYITRTMQERTSFDMEKLRPFLEEIGKWNDVLAPDAKLLEKILPTFTDDEREKILEAREKKSFPVLKQTKKK